MTQAPSSSTAPSTGNHLSTARSSRATSHLRSEPGSRRSRPKTRSPFAQWLDSESTVKTQPSGPLPSIASSKTLAREVRPRPEPGEGIHERLGREEKRARLEWKDPEPLTLDSFRALPVLQPPTASDATAAGSGLERAQAAAMAERVLHSVRVGKVSGRHEVRLRLSSRVEVRLHEVDGLLRPELHLPEGAGHAAIHEAEALAERLGAELTGAGIQFQDIDIVR